MVPESRDAGKPSSLCTAYGANIFSQQVVQMLPHQRSGFTAEPWLLSVDEEAEDDFARIRWETRVLVTLGDRPMVTMGL